LKLISLISGGIDSPVATYMMAGLGADIVLLHMDNRPYAEDASIERVMDLAEQLRSVTGLEMPLYSAPHGRLQEIISQTCDHNYQCVMCKRIMQRTARDLGIKLGCTGIVMGDSLGQVASQTLRNIRFENLGLDFPVLRPLIGYDKLDIECIAKQIGTYEISIIPVKGCTIVPLKPITEADMDKVHIFDSASDMEHIAADTAAAAIRLS
jgi:tRNA uracil 4-sulfurtransferase